MAISQTRSDHSLPKEQTKQIAQKSKKSFKRRPSRQKDLSLKFKIEKNRIEEKISALLKFIRNNPAAPYSSSVTSVRGNASLSTLTPAKQQKPSVITNRTRAVPLETLETGKTPSVSPVGSEQSAKKQESRKRKRKDNKDNGSKRARIQDDSLVDSLIAQFAKLSLLG
ncbi:uncharacterized protein LOC144620810 isoform X2 [Crassostrea virginica]